MWTCDVAMASAADCGGRGDLVLFLVSRRGAAQESGAVSPLRGQSPDSWERAALGALAPGSTRIAPRRVHVGGEWFEVSRPPYLPVEMRWETAVADGLPVDVSHAFGISDRTLCGIQEVGMSPSDYGWLPERENACGACREAAGVIDDRWPQA